MVRLKFPTVAALRRKLKEKSSWTRVSRRRWNCSWRTQPIRLARDRTFQLSRECLRFRQMQLILDPQALSTSASRSQWGPSNQSLSWNRDNRLGTKNWKSDTCSLTTICQVLISRGVEVTYNQRLWFKNRAPQMSPMLARVDCHRWWWTRMLQSSLLPCLIRSLDLHHYPLTRNLATCKSLIKSSARVVRFKVPS